MSSDHVLFDQAIRAFTAPPNGRAVVSAETGHGYLLLDFEISHPLETARFRVSPTLRIQLPGPYAAFIAEVHPRTSMQWEEAHWYAIAISAILGFCLGRPVRSPRNDWLFGRRALNQEKLLALAVQSPVLIAGPGAHTSMLSPATLSGYATRINEVLDLLSCLSEEQAALFLRAFRLVQLAHNCVREDFSLAYYLLVSAIEILATRAIERDKVVEEHKSQNDWIARARKDREFASLFRAYKAELHKQQYLAKRFVEFVLRYSPPSRWVEHDHPLTETESFVQHISGRSVDLSSRRLHEVYPDDLDAKTVKNVLRDLYVHRSKFTHEGAAPPHRNPQSYNRYFDEEFNYDNRAQGIVSFLLPNYGLIAFIARCSALGYVRELAANARPPSSTLATADDA